MIHGAHAIESGTPQARRLAASSLYVVFKLMIITGKFGIGQILSLASTTILKAIQH
jgi:hypothetical protein